MLLELRSLGFIRAQPNHQSEICWNQTRHKQAPNKTKVGTVLSPCCCYVQSGALISVVEPEPEEPQLFVLAEREPECIPVPDMDPDPK